jgi:hypothetical protein
MPDGAGWRSEESTDYLDDVQRSGFAWEFLRRDPLYRQDYQEMSLLLDSEAPNDQEVALALAKRWGLNFSEWSSAAQRSSAHALGSKHPTGGGHPDHVAA